MRGERRGGAARRGRMIGARFEPPDRGLPVRARTGRAAARQPIIESTASQSAALPTKPSVENTIAALASDCSVS